MNTNLLARHGLPALIKAKAVHTPVLSRVVAALFGGYVLAHTASIALFGALPMARGEAAMAAIQFSFVIYTLAVIWAFAARRVWSVWLGILVPTGVTGLIAWLVV